MKIIFIQIGSEIHTAGASLGQSKNFWFGVSDTSLQLETHGKNDRPKKLLLASLSCLCN